MRAQDLKRETKLYIYLDRKEGGIIGIKSKQKPRKSKRMKVVYEYLVKEKGFGMAPFPEIPNNVFFSDRFLFIGKLGKENLI
jgi:hypothetical protein